jgi:hypothetical protein
MGIALLFGFFPDVPGIGHGCGGFELFVAENMRMAADHFRVDFRQGVGRGKLAPFFEHAGKKDDLHQNVPQLLGRSSGVVSLHSVERFVDFLKE